MPFLPTLAERIDGLLPQTQCTKCGYDGCRPYAEAIAAGDAAINRCPPGGDAGIAALARLLDTPELPLDTGRGQPGPLTAAVIDEAHCIGCTLCIQACPVDAIVGAAKRMHTVLPELCTGCDLCLPPCPVDCIAMLPAGRAWTPADAQAARSRHVARRERLARAPAEQQRLMAETPEALAPQADTSVAQAVSADAATAGLDAAPHAAPEAERRRTAIESALARARARRQAR
ncbi:ferredoxin [Bordetella ansorpii]|uniref:Ferredoxin n=1 Tax=Bordetella ansorpii TaxID=288768 RepID=A0A157STA9_9BORD|nr:electron transport complex subunit RsxB [Bordetella ansorpii]SAI73669.1 ferredoxin [Bordetella ansorpii]